jgi:outer membrane protein
MTCNASASWHGGCKPGHHLMMCTLNLRRLAALALIAVAWSGAAAQTEKLTLEDAIKRALQQNYTIKGDSYEVSIARARVLEQLGIFDPAISATYSSSGSEGPQLRDALTGLRPPSTEDRSDSYDLSLGGVMPWGLTYRLGATQTNVRGTFNAFADTYSTFAGASARQPLLRDFGFGATTAQIRIAMTNRAISEWVFKQSVIDTLTRVIFAYYDLNFAHANLRSALRSRELAAQLLSENEKRFKVGAMSEFDVTSARSRLANREESILNAQRLVRETENNLKALISDQRSPDLLTWHLEIDPITTLPVTVVDPASDFQEALNMRPDYQQAKLAVKRGDINFRLQRNQALPRVDLVGSYGYAGLDRDDGVARRMVRNEDDRAYTYGVQVTVPLTFTAERGRYRAAKFALRQAETDLQQIEQNIVVAVGNAAANIETTYQRVKATRVARELGQQALEAEEKRLRAGTGNTFFVVQQQELLANLEVAELRAQSDYRKAVAEYDRQLGMTLSRLNVEIEMPR